MDPVCHTLAGAALAQAGLKHKTALGTATLVIGANLPDLDIVSLGWGTVPMLEFRRGWTHGVVALAVLPVLLTGLMLAWDHIVRKRSSEKIPASSKQLLLLSGVAVWSHPALDWLNVYGMRWLAPFSDRWSYGDALFIVDPWLWVALAAGIVWSMRRERHKAPAESRPAQVALVVVLGYILSMLGLGLATERRIEAAYTRQTGAPPRRVMAAPVPANPLRRWVVIETADRLIAGEYRWIRGGWQQLDQDFPTLATGMGIPAVHQAAVSARGRGFLRWARFPTYVPADRGGVPVVVLIDVRYATDPDARFGTVAIPPSDEP